MNKAILLLLLFFIVAINSFGQVIDTAFYSPSLDETRNVDVYLPPGYNSNQSLYYPVIYVFHGWGGSENSAITIMNEAELLINSGTIDPLIIVCANNSPTPFLGSFFVNSSLYGDYEEFNTVDLVEWIETTYRTKTGKNYRSILGQSMGGYGAFRYAILHDTMYRAIASHGSAINFDLAISDISISFCPKIQSQFYLARGKMMNYRCTSQISLLRIRWINMT